MRLAKRCRSAQSLGLAVAATLKVGFNPEAAGAFISAITSDLRRRARARKLRGRLQIGSLTVVQRFGSSLNLNVHFHTVALDGVYAQQPDGGVLFPPLPGCS